MDGETFEYFARCAAVGLDPETARVSYVCRLIGPRAALMPSTSIAAAVRVLCWMDEPPAVPVRVPVVAERSALPADLATVPFRTYLTAENYFQSYLRTLGQEGGPGLVSTLYPGLPAEAVEPWMVYQCVQWLTGLKASYSARYPHLFRPAPPDPGGELPDMLEILNVQVRALTGGDVTKEGRVFRTETWRALTELDAKAREAEEWESKNK